MRSDALDPAGIDWSTVTDSVVYNAATRDRIPEAVAELERRSANTE